MKKHDFVTTGIPSIFTIFTVLVLVILSLMSYGTSLTDREESRLSYEMTLDYYEAGNLATDVISEALRLAGAEGLPAMRAYLTSQDGEVTCNCQEEEARRTYRMEIAYSDRQSLLVELSENPKGQPLTIDTWMSIQRGSWENGATMNLFKPGQGF